MTKKLTPLQEFREIRRNPFSADSLKRHRELVRSGHWDKFVTIERREFAPEMAKKRYPDLTDEEVHKIEAKYPFYSSDSWDWSIALARWVEYQVMNKEKFSERKRNALLSMANYIQETFGTREERGDVFYEDEVSDLMRAAYLIGVYCPSPYETLRTHKIREIKATKVQMRLEAITPLVLEEAKINRKAIPKRAFGEANKLLKAKGLVHKKKGISLRTFAGYVSQILAENPE